MPSSHTPAQTIRFRKHFRFLLVQLTALRPNPSLEPTRYGRLCKPGLRYAVHSLSPGLQSLPPRAAQLER
jgi:hypothetical protein